MNPNWENDKYRGERVYKKFASKNWLKLYDQTENLENILRAFESVAPEPIEIDESLPWPKRIKKAREDACLSNADAAEMLGLSGKVYSRFEQVQTSRPKIPTYDLRRLPVKAKEIIMDIDEMSNGDLIIHPRYQGTPLHLLHLADRQYLFQKLVDIAAYYKGIDPEIRLYYSFHSYVLRRNMSEDPLVTPVEMESPFIFFVSNEGEEEIEKGMPGFKKEKAKEKLTEEDIARKKEYHRKYMREWSRRKKNGNIDKGKE